MAQSSTDDSSVKQRMLELEQELIEFQESSKELEQALEEELRDLETRNTSLTTQLEAKDTKIQALAQTVARLTTEINEQLAVAAEKTAASETLVAELKHKLVHMEILNDDMLSHDRILDSKYQLAIQFNNELLEKIALVENELELERQANAQNRLTISNLENELSSCLESCKQVEKPNTQGQFQSLKHKSAGSISKMKRESTYHDLSFADGTILDIGEMLASEPPENEMRELPHSESLHKFHELYSKSGALRQKVGEVNMSLALKSPSTTQLTKQNTSSGVSTPTIVPVCESYITEKSLEKKAQGKEITKKTTSNTETPKRKATLKNFVKGILRA